MGKTCPNQEKSEKHLSANLSPLRCTFAAFMNRPVRVRFAPSPTGPLHIGGVRTALYNYLFARQHGGTFILRIEDTDQTRYVPGAEEYIIESLKWLGLMPDEGVSVGGPHAPYRQSERKPMYRQYAEKMIADGNAYYAFDTPDELEAMREKMKASGMSAKYDATSRMSMVNSLTLSEDEVQKRLERGDDYVIRIKLPRKEEVRFHDTIRGWVVVHTQQMDDKVLLKGDGMPTYHLANVVDDYLMGISHVIRGEEWLPSAPLHVMLYRYLGWEEHMPEFAHLPLILKPEGNGKLSKRDGDRLGFPVFPLEWKDPFSGEISSGYRESGYLPEAVINILAFLGWHPSDNRELMSLDELVQDFGLDRVSKSGAKFDQDKAKWFNHQYLMRCPNERLAEMIRPQLASRSIEAKEAFLDQVISLTKEKMPFVADFYHQAAFFFEAPSSYDEQVVSKKWKEEVPLTILNLSHVFEALEVFEAEACETAVNAYCEQNGIKAGGIMQPLRLAVSGRAGGPPLFEMIALLGKAEVVRRMKHAVETLQPAANS